MSTHKHTYPFQGPHTSTRRHTQAHICTPPRHVHARPRSTRILCANADAPAYIRSTRTRWSKPGIRVSAKYASQAVIFMAAFPAGKTIVAIPPRKSAPPAITDHTAELRARADATVQIAPFLHGRVCTRGSLRKCSACGRRWMNRYRGLRYWRSSRFWFVGRQASVTSIES